MKRFRILLYIPSLVLEVLLILICVAMIPISVQKVESMAKWVDRFLPPPQWYFEGFK